MLQNTVKLLSAKCDSNEWYSCRVLLRINNIPLPAINENKGQLMMIWLRLGIYSTR